MPATGSLVSRAELETVKAKLDTLIVGAREFAKQGVPKDVLLSKLANGDLGWQLHLTRDELDHFCTELVHKIEVRRDHWRL